MPGNVAWASHKCVIHMFEYIIAFLVEWSRSTWNTQLPNRDADIMKLGLTYHSTSILPVKKLNECLNDSIYRILECWDFRPHWFWSFGISTFRMILFGLCSFILIAQTHIFNVVYFYAYCTSIGDIVEIYINMLQQMIITWIIILSLNVYEKNDLPWQLTNLKTSFHWNGG